MTTGDEVINNNELQFPDLHAMTPRPEQISSNFAVLKAVDRVKRQLSIDDKDVEREQKRLALETALLVQQEVERWEASIRELEGLLQQQQHQSVADKDNGEDAETGAVNEETLPVVVDDEEEVDELSSPSFGISSSPRTQVDDIPSQ